MDKLYIVVPAYNEEENIEKIVIEWMNVIKKISNESRLVVINDGSKDNTYSKLNSISKKYAQLIVLDKENSGHGPSVIYGYKYAIDKGADWIFQTDSDGQTNPDEFEGFWNLRNNFDAIIGNRIKRGDGKIRAIVEKVVCLLLKIFFGVSVPDANAPYRLMKKNLVEKYIIMLPDNYNLPNIMLTAFFAFYKENIYFKEITFKPRQAGINNINIKKIFSIGYRSLKDFGSFRKEMKNNPYKK